MLLREKTFVEQSKAIYLVQTFLGSSYDLADNNTQTYSLSSGPSVTQLCCLEAKSDQYSLYPQT